MICYHCGEDAVYTLRTDDDIFPVCGDYAKGLSPRERERLTPVNTMEMSCPRGHVAHPVYYRDLHGRFHPYRDLVLCLVCGRTYPVH